MAASPRRRSLTATPSSPEVLPASLAWVWNKRRKFANWRGGERTSGAGIDPDTGEVVRLFHPRRDQWVEHFALDGPRLCGRTAIGRTTAWLLQMNSEERVELRTVLMALGEWG